MNAILLAALIVVQATGTYADTCAGCVTTYEAAKTTNAGNNAALCTDLKNFLTCLVTGTACPLDAAKATAIATDLSGLGADCTLTDVCTCQKDYFATDQTGDDTDICTAVTTYYSCLVGKTTAACDGSSTVSALATAAESSIPGTCAEKTDTCDCEITFTKADVSTDSKKCTAAILYYQCLGAASGAGCDGSTVVADLQTAADTIIGGITDCDRTAKTCAVCESEYEAAKAAAGDDDAKCDAIKDYMTCLEGAAFCPLTAAQAAAIGTDYGAITCSTPLTAACTCQKDYWMSDMTDDTKVCTAAKNRIGCLVGKNDAACDGSTIVKALAGPTKTILDGMSSCTKTDVCACEITYANADIATATDRCTATNTMATCIQTSINNGCGASSTKTTVGTAVQAAYTDMTATNCAVTATCQCQLDFLTASVTSANKCTSATTLDSCLGNITSTTEDACDGSTKTAALRTSLKTSVKNVVCSSPGLKSSIVISLLMLLTSVLFISP